MMTNSDVLKQLDQEEYIICHTFGEIFETAAKWYIYDSFVEFVPAFMKSSFCRHAWDTDYSRYQFHEPEESLDFIIPEIKDKCTLVKAKDDDDIFNPDIAFWVGFTYHELYIYTGKPSAELIDMIPFENMCAMYPGMHTIDEDQAAEIIIEQLKRKGLL